MKCKKSDLNNKKKQFKKKIENIKIQRKKEIWKREREK